MFFFIKVHNEACDLEKIYLSIIKALIFQELSASKNYPLKVMEIDQIMTSTAVNN
jgi:hypothetical protein